MDTDTPLPLESSRAALEALTQRVARLEREAEELRGIVDGTEAGVASPEQSVFVREHPQAPERQQTAKAQPVKPEQKARALILKETAAKIKQAIKAAYPDVEALYVNRSG
jgi:hypothetical protein